MEDRFSFFAVIAGTGVLVLTLVLARHDRKRLSTKQSVRRGAGNALLGLQQFIEPSVEHVFQSQNVEQREEDDDQGQGGDEEAVRSGLAEALACTPIDLEDVRRHLTGAARLGLDWKAVFDQAVADELRERPFRAPSMPPVRRVAPRE